MEKVKKQSRGIYEDNQEKALKLCRCIYKHRFHKDFTSLGKWEGYKLQKTTSLHFLLSLNNPNKIKQQPHLSHSITPKTREINFPVQKNNEEQINQQQRQK